MKGRDGMITPYVRCLSCLPVTLRCLHGRTCLELVDRLTTTYFAPTWASAPPPPQASGLRPALLPCDRPPLVTRLILFMGFASASDPMTFRSSRHLSPFGGYTHWSVHLVGLMLSIPPMYWLVGPRALTCEEVRPSDELCSSMSSFGTLDQGASPFNLDQYRQPCLFFYICLACQDTERVFAFPL